MTILSTSKSVYAGGAAGLMGGLIIGMGIGLLILAPLMIRTNETWTNEINDILGTWRSLHPSDNVPTANVPSLANAEVLGVTAIFLGIAVGAIGVYRVSSLLLSVSPEPPIDPPQPSTVSPKEKKYCGSCGTENRINGVRCKKCGKYLEHRKATRHQ